jgi:RHS repeat-associated protein
MLANPKYSFLVKSERPAGPAPDGHLHQQHERRWLHSGRTGVARAGRAGLATTYAYDAISRLSSLQQALAGAAGTTFGFTYNAANQVVSRTDSSGAYTVAPAASAATYGVNGLNQYTSISGVEPVGSGPAMTMTYDPLGRLSSITRGGITTDLLYDGAFLAGAYNPDGAISARYVPGPGADEPLTVYTGPGTSSVAWYVPDQEGSIIATADQNANATAQYAYDPYGVPLNSAGGIDWSGPRYSYTGQIQLGDAQTYFYKARMYDPTTGRFFQTDPAGFQGGINLYAYAMNDPVNGWDPTGLLIYSNTVNGISAVCDTQGAATQSLGDTDDYWIDADGNYNTFSGNCSYSYADAGSGGVLPPTFGGGGNSQAGNSNALSVGITIQIPRPSHCLTGDQTATAESVIKGGTQTATLGAALLASAAGAEAAGGGPADPLADAFAVSVGPTGKNLVRAGTAVAAGGAAFLSTHGQYQEAVNSVFDGLLDLADKPFVPDSAQPALDEIFNGGIGLIEDATGLITDTCSN